jgi:hypothetical protein
MRVCESRIEAVRVYRVGATVRRRFDVGPGDLELEVPGLPLSLDDSTVRVRALGAADAPVPVDLRVGLHAKAREDAATHEAERELEELRREQTRDARRRDLLTAESELLESIATPPRPRGEPGRPPPASPLEARLALDEFKHGELEERITEIDAITERMLDREERIADLVDTLRRVSSAKKARADEVTKSVTMRLRGELAGGAPVTYELEYYVPGARWAPQYQCHVDREGERAQVQSRALVVQRSGEDWVGVKLELSTADPVRFSELPKLSSIRIGKAQRGGGPSKGFRPAPRGAAGLFGDYDAALARARVLAPTASVAAASAPYVSEAMGYGTFRAAMPPQVVAVAAGGLSESTNEIYEEVEGFDDDVIGDFGEFEEEPDEMYAAREMAAPMAEPSPAPQMAYASAPAPAPPSAPKRRRSKKMADTGSRGAPGGASFGGAADERERGITLGGQRQGPPGLPQFSALELAAPDDTARRGTLQRVDQRAAYAAALARSGREPDFDLIGVVRQAAQAAAGAWGTSMPAHAADVAAESGAFDYVYHSESRVEVASDGIYHSVPLGVREAPCQMRYVVVPREEPHVYRMATIENPTAAPMLAGPVEVYVGGAYVLSTRLPTVAPRAEFKLGLGVEQAIKCARNARFEERRTDSGVVATAELHHQIDIELVNNLGRPVRCEVRERIPQPAKDAEVVVDEGVVSPAWEEYTQRDRRRIKGGRRWDVEIAAGATQKLSAEYVVKIYAQNEVVGGNRREE